jgi:FkbM family methyltransferase
MTLSQRIKLKIGHYHSALGVKGVLLFLFSKVTGIKPVVRVNVRGIKHPVWLRVGTTDACTYMQVLVGRQYEFDQPRTARFIVDAGANIGLSAVFLANRYPDARIVAIEPEPSNFEMLCKNTALYPMIKPVRAALWRTNEELFVFDTGHGNHGFQVEKKTPADRAGSVPGITVDAIMRDEGVEWLDLLKMDIEGAEREVLGDCANWIGKIDTLMIELHDYIKPGCSIEFNKATSGFSKPETNGETTMRHRMATGQAVADGS